MEKDVKGWNGQVTGREGSDSGRYGNGRDGQPVIFPMAVCQVSVGSSPDHL